MTWEDRDQPDEWLQPWEDAYQKWNDDLAGPEYWMAFDIPWYHYNDPDPYAPRARWVSDR